MNGDSVNRCTDEYFLQDKYLNISKYISGYVNPKINASLTILLELLKYLNYLYKDAGLNKLIPLCI